MVLLGLYPIESNKYNDLQATLEKLQLNDASLQVNRKLLKPSVLVSIVVMLRTSSYGHDVQGAWNVSSILT